MAEHYGVAVIPARVRAPKDKAKAEIGVYVVERWWIAWQTDAGAASDEDEIFLARIDGSNPRNITRSAGNDGHPWFSRDGKWIVFESDRSGTSEIWKINLKTLTQEQLTFGGKEYMSRTPRW